MCNIFETPRRPPSLGRKAKFKFIKGRELDIITTALIPPQEEKSRSRVFEGQRAADALSAENKSSLREWCKINCDHSAHKFASGFCFLHASFPEKESPPAINPTPRR